MELTGAMLSGVSSRNGVLRAEHAAADMIPVLELVVLL